VTHSAHLSATRLAARPLRHAAITVATASVLLAALLTAAAGPAAAQPNPADWPAFLEGPSHTSYNAAATAITASNASTLAQEWSWPTPPSPNSGPNTMNASPTVVDGVVYIGAMDGYFYAIDESTQAVLWSDFLGLDTPKGTDPCGKKGQGITATAAVADDPVTGTPTVFVNAPDGNLYALNAQTGAVIWTGQVDVPSQTVNDYYSWSSPLVANGKVYVGISSDCDSPLIPGGVIAFSQSTGAKVARWVDVPNKPALYGGSVWSSPALLSNGDIVAATGNGYKNSGEPLYDDSIVELDPNTLAVVGYWQIPAAEQINDGDFGASPTIWNATINGVPTPMVGDCDKNGYYYALEQDNINAGPVWSARVTEPYPGGETECASAAVSDGNQLIVGGGAPTTIDGTTYPGSVQSFNPATGAVNWQTGLQGTIVGTPTEDAGGLVAAQVYVSSDNQRGVYLLDAATGAVVGFIKTGVREFSQAVFDHNDLIVGGGGAYGVHAYGVPTAGPPITKVSPDIIAPGTATTVTLTGSGFSGTPSVQVSGNAVTVKSVTVVSPTTIKTRLFVGSGATLDARDVTVTEPGLVEDSCSSCLTIGTPPPPPAPTSITPSTFAAGSTNTPVTIDGSNFEPGATVSSHSGIKVSSVTFVSSGELTASITVAGTVAPGTYNLFVHNPDGYSGKCAGCLTVT
jgi:outer membrane protein assembly factor BamB